MNNISEVIDKHLTTIAKQMEAAGGHVPEIWEGMIRHQSLLGVVILWLA